MSDVRSARPVRRRLDCRLAPTEVLRLLRDEPGLCALIGDWHRGGAVVAFAPQHVAAATDDPFDLVGDRPDLDADLDDDTFGGGWIGYWGYRLGGRIERLPDPPRRPAPLPEFQLAYYDHVLRYDAATATWWFEALVTNERAAFVDRQYERIRPMLQAARREPEPYTLGPFTMTPDPGTHREVVAATLDHIAAGDIFQANLCVRLEASLDGDPLDIFCAGVEALAPRYGAYVGTTDGGAVASLSPELFVRRRGRDVLTSPIKGTAPLSSDVRELAASYKNRAENIMIVDLMRNDLGRVCAPGSIRVPDQPRAEPHTGVWHLVSDVHGRLRDDADDAGLLRAAFPPGSVTGAPKVRAMQIINELETTGREVYTGSVGYVSPCAGLELNVAIRTFEFRDDTVWLGVGGGIVADSRPDDELRECLVKASPLLDAIGGRVDDGVLAAVGPATPARPEAPGITVTTPGGVLPQPDRSAGVFETLRVADGVAERLDAHLARLAMSLASVYGSDLPPGLRERVRAAAAELSRPHRMRVTVAPGAAEPVTIESAPLPDGAPAPWRLVPCVLPGGMGAHKWQDRRVLDAVEPEPGVWTADRDALLVDSDGTVLETGRGNLFVVDDHGVHTPALDGRILPGVTRARVLDVLRAAGVPTSEGRITLDDVARASEVFVTNALRGAAAVLECAGIGRWEPGPTTRWLGPRLGAAQPAASVRPRVDADRVLLIDNYDSFVYNLDQYCQELGVSTAVVRNDAVTPATVEEQVHAGAYDRIVISPGPGTPQDAGISTEIVRRLGPYVPILGVCLGHQCIGEAYGASVVRAGSVVHGKTSLVHHDGRGVFAGIDGPLASGRYHSLVVDESTLPHDLAATAHTASGVLMGVRHRSYPVEGVQLHPESVLTGHGHRLLANFLAAGRDHPTR